MKYEPFITFARIIDVYVAVRRRDLGTGTCQAIVRNVTILDGTGDGDDETSDPSRRNTKMGNIISLYNLVFVPIMKNYLLHNKPLRRNVAVLRRVIANRSSLDQAEKTASTGNTAASLTQNERPVSTAVQEGNVSIHVTVGDDGPNDGDARRAAPTQMMMIDQHRNDITRQHIPGALPEDLSGYRTFLRFGRASGSKVRLIESLPDSGSRSQFVYLICT